MAPREDGFWGSFSAFLKGTKGPSGSGLWDQGASIPNSLIQGNLPLYVACLKIGDPPKWIVCSLVSLETRHFLKEYLQEWVMLTPY